jgi:hypothetical protein
MRKQARAGGLVGAGLSPAPTYLKGGRAGGGSRADRLSRVARLLILGGGCRGLWLVREVAREGHAARVVTREESRRAQIEEAGAECWIGDPDRLGTLRGALDGVTIACWLLGTASGPQEQLQALHGARLGAFIMQTVDSTVRGLIYEATGSVSAGLLGTGAQIARETSSRNAIPLVLLTTDPAEQEAWSRQALAAIRGLLGGETAGLA